MSEQTVSKTTERYRARMEKVLEILAARNGEKMTIADLANSASMSPFHFHRIFRVLTGETVGAVTRRFRLARALRQLRDSDRSITEIALEAGYDSSQNFAKAFKAATNATPSEARGDSELTDILIHRLAMPRLIIKKDYAMSDVQITSVPTFTTVGVQHQGPFTELGAAYQKLMHWVGSNNLIPQFEGLYCVYYNDPAETAAEELRAAACVKLSGSIEPGEGMEAVALGGGDHAVLIHKGPYEKMQESYDALYGRWLPASGREPADKPPFEKYLNDPSTTKPEDLRTEIYLPLV